MSTIIDNIIHLKNFLFKSLADSGITENTIKNAGSHAKKAFEFFNDTNCLKLSPAKMIINVLFKDVCISIIVFILSIIFAFIGLILINVIKTKNKFLKFLKYVYKKYLAITKGFPLFLFLQFITIWYTPPKDVNIFAVSLLFSAAIITDVYEIIYTGYDNISIEQFEAAECSGLSKKDFFIKIMCPQIFNNIHRILFDNFATIFEDVAVLTEFSYYGLFKYVRNLCYICVVIPNNDQYLICQKIFLNVLLISVYILITFICTKISSLFDKDNCDE